MESISSLSSATLKYFRQSAERLSGSLKRIADGQRVPEPRADPAVWKEITSLEHSARKLTLFSDNLERAGVSVRVAAESMKAAGQQLEAMEGSLREALAAPEGSRARAQWMTEYIRMVPLLNDLADAPDEGARRLLSDPEEVPGAGDLRIRAGENNMNIVIKHQPIHTGPGGLDIPAPEGYGPFSNEDLGLMIERIEGAREALIDKTKELGGDVLAVTQSRDFNLAFLARDRGQAERMNLIDLNEEAALTNAFQLRNSVALFGLSSINETAQAALRLLR